MNFYSAAILIAFAATAQAPEQEPRWRELNLAARSAVQANDYAKLRDVLLELRPLLPGNPRIVYNLAASEAMLQHPDAALLELSHLANMGLDYDLGADTDFSSLRGKPEFQAILDRIALSKKPITHSSLAFTLAERDLIPEDIAYDPKTRRFFVSSARRGKIITPDGKAFAKSDLPVMALRVESVRRTLWASTGWLPQCDTCRVEDKDKTALLAFDLDSGALKQRIESPLKGMLGDLTVSSAGDVFVTEGLNGAVLRLAAGRKEFERLDTPGEFPSPQTPALSSDEKSLYIPDYARGIARMNLADRQVTWMQPAPGIALNGIDGLYVWGDWFLAVQNGSKPARVIRFSLDLQKQEVLEANSTGLGEPTHGVVVGGDFYFIANSGWSEYEENGKKKQGSRPVESTIRKMTLHK